METDPIDREMATRLAQIRIPDGSDSTALEHTLGCLRRQRSRRRARGVVLTAAAVLGATASLALGARIAEWGPFTPPPPPQPSSPQFEELMGRLGYMDAGMTAVELVSVPTDEGPLTAHYAQGRDRRTVFITGPHVTHLPARDCATPWPWPDPGPGPDGQGRVDVDGQGSYPDHAPVGGLITYCSATFGAAGPHGVVLAAVHPRVASAEVELADGTTVEAGVANNALLAALPWVACDDPRVAQALVLRDATGAELLRLDQTDPPGWSAERPFPNGCI